VLTCRRAAYRRRPQTIWEARDIPKYNPPAIARQSKTLSRTRHASARFARDDPFWPAQLTILAAIGLYFALPNKLTVGPTWLLPVLEGVLLVGLVISTPPHREVQRHSQWRRRLALGLTAFVSLANIVSLYLLVHYLLKGGRVGGHPLIGAGIVLWVTNVLLFGLWYWELDRGGPVARKLEPDTMPDFLFPQMTQEGISPPGWRPVFIDYMYTSFTNATAFSPTDTMPLTPMAKLLMTIQSAAALLTIALVLARAVNILS